MPLHGVLRSVHYTRQAPLTDTSTRTTQAQIRKSLVSPRLEMQDVVCVGDLVCLYCEESRGYIFNFTSSSTHNTVMAFSEQDKDTPENVTDPQGITFEIEVKNRYKSQKRLWEYRREADQDENKLQELEKAANSEIEENRLEQKRHRGARLRYGQVIQLKHQFTGNYVHIRTTLTSQRDKNYMAVELYDYNIKQAQYRILPGFKVKSEGDLVQVGDQVVFESIKSPLQFLHVSSPATVHFTGARNETAVGTPAQFCVVNLGVQKSGFTIMRYRHQDNNKLLKGGSAVRLFHKEQESYLVAQGYLHTVTQQCHLRVRPVDQHLPSLMQYTTSGLTLWQLEHIGSIINGGPLKWEQCILIRHMVTRHYLAVDASGRVVIMPDRSRPEVVFRLHSVTKESPDMEYGSYARIQHALTGKWLHAAQEEFVCPREGGSTSLGDLCEEWSPAAGASPSSLGHHKVTKRVIHAESGCRYDDAFTLQEVKPSYLEQFNFIVGMMPSVLQLQHDIAHKSLRNRDLVVFSSMLDQLTQYLVVDGEPVETRQKLLRNVMIVDILVKILHCDDLSKFGVKSLCEKIYQLLEHYLKGNNRKNELYIARHIHTFTSHIDKQTSLWEPALEMVIELVRDNKYIVDTLSREKEKYILKYVNLLKKCKDFRYLEMLSVFCVCDGFTLSENQKYITSHWLDQADPGDSLFLTKMGIEPNLLYLSTDKGDSWNPLHHYCPGEVMENSPEYRFFQCQLDLFEKLCEGRNRYVIAVLSRQGGCMPWEEAFHCLQDEMLPADLRAIYCRLVVVMFVDIAGKNNSTLSFVYSCVKEKAMKEKSKRFSDRLSVSQKERRADSTTHVRNEKHEHSPSTRMCILREWIAGFLKKQHNIKAHWESAKLTEQVLLLVQYLVGFGQYTLSQDITLLKQSLLHLLTEHNHQQVAHENGERELDISLNDCRKTSGFDVTLFNKVIMRAMEVVDLLLSQQLHHKLEVLMGMFKYCSLYQDNKPREDQKQDLIAGLLDDNWTNHSEFTKRCRKEMGRLNAEIPGFKEQELTEILLVGMFAKVLSHSQNRQIVTRSISLLIKLYSQTDQLFTKAMQATLLVNVESCKVHDVVMEKLEILRCLSTAKFSSQEAHDLCAIMDRFAGFCSIDQNDGHQINPLILINCGIPEVLRGLLEQGIGTAARDQPNLTCVIVSALMLLRVLVKRNKHMQKFTFTLCEDILDIQGTEAEAAKTLTEVFTGHFENCLTISPHLIQKIVGLATLQEHVVPEFLDLLCAIVKIDELNEPLKRNQDFVMKYVMENYPRIGHLFDDTERDRILRGEAGPQMLSYLVSLVNLLANCAEGVNRFTESLCQALLPIEDILDVLNTTDLHQDLKKPFLRLLTWGHLHTTTGNNHTPVELSHSLEPFLEKLVIDARELIKYVKSTEFNSWRQSSGGSDGSPDITDRAGLFYFIDAVLPFVGTFYEVLNLDAASDRFQASSMELAVVLQDFATYLPRCNRFQSASVIMGLSGIVKVMADPEILEVCLDKLKSDDSPLPVSDTRGTKEDPYKDEILCNHKLKTFVHNLEKAYRGPNTVTDQIHFTSTEAYTIVGEEEALPLGPDFQNLVRCFEDCTHTAALLDQLYISSTSLSTEEKKSTLQVGVDVKCLQVLRALIHNELCMIQPGPEDDRHFQAMVHLQNTLLEQGAVPKTLPLLQRSDYTLVREYLAFSNCLLSRLNTKAQVAFKECFSGNREETFFSAVRTRIEMSMLYTREKAHLIAQYEANSQRVKARQALLQQTYRRKKEESRNKMPPEFRGATSLPASETSVSSTRSPSLLTKRASKVSPPQEMHTVGFDNSLDGNNNVQKKSPEEASVAGSEVKHLKELETDEDLEHVNIKDQGFIEQVLILMGRMCDGQYTDLQDLLREQPDHYKSANLVADTTSYLALLYSHIRPENIHLLTQVFSTLNELASGNIENQFVIFEQHIVEYVNYILRDSLESVGVSMKLKLWSAIGHLLMSLVEETQPENEKLLQEVASILDSESVGRVAVYWRKEGHRLQPQDANLAEDVGFQYFFLLMRLKDLGAEIQEFLVATDDKQVEHNTFQFYRESHQSIEILKDNQVQVLRFRLREKYVLRESVKETLKWTIDRTSPTSKLRELMEWSRDIVDDFNYEKKLQSHRILNHVTNYWELWNNLLFLLSLVICVLMLVTWDAKTSMSDLPRVGEALMTPNSSLYDPVPDYPSWYFIALMILGGAHTIVSLMIVVVFFTIHPPRLNLIQTIKEHYSQSRLLGLKPSVKDRRKSHLKVDLLSFTTFYHLALVTCSVLGMTYHGYFFAFHLLNIVYKNQLLRRVILAVTLNGRSLLWVALLGLIIIFQFSLVAFAHFRYAMDPNGLESTLYCGDLVECTVTLLRYGLVGDLFEKMAVYESQRGFHNFGVLAAYHIAFFILITTVGLNIVFGIILDTFSQLRHAKWIAERDMKEQCFICGNPAHLFESNGKGFHQHVKAEHNMWSYILFFIHLSSTKRADLTHLELYVEDLRSRCQYDFFPVNRALSLNVDQDDKAEKLDEILDKVRAVMDRSEREDRVREREEERRRQEHWEREHRHTRTDRKTST